MAAENLTLYVAPETWTNSAQKPYKTPYRRIVAIESGRHVLRTLVAYPTKRITTERLVAPEAFARRLFDFYSRFLVSTPESEYNCHIFADYMANGVLRTYDDAQKRAEETARYGIEVPWTLPFAARGVITSGWVKGVEHSIVGLGHADPFALQVMEYGSYLGLQTYANSKKHFKGIVSGVKLFQEIPA